LSQQTLNRPWYIVFEGAIGVGKTTLARMIREEFETELLLEVFEENPFLAKFYQDRARYAFQTQMFFLLSRYRQQRNQVPQLLNRGALIADYMFAKDRLFAQLNLAGDEWDVYQQIHRALAEQIPNPDLIVYLQADTETLMGRIAQRDRPYERDMDLGYINTLRQTYEQFFIDQQEIPILFIDTNPLNFVTRQDDFQLIVERIRSVLQEGDFQQPIPQLGVPLQSEDLLSQGRPLADFQRFHVELDRAKNFDTDVYFNYLCLSEEIGELGSELANLWREEHLRRAQGTPTQQAKQQAMTQRRAMVREELADCMAYLLKLANYAGIDLETAYLEKMRENQDRVWRETESDLYS
jgi:deoxyadenosine/deoxycytidine kinase/NTP pyrophosphatase (non-canonical NTP hydrolase)